MSCEHDLVVSPDPQDGRREIVRCLKCDRKNTRLAVAESIREQAEQEMRAIQIRTREQLDAVQLVVTEMAASIRQLRTDLDAVKAEAARE